MDTCVDAASLHLALLRVAAQILSSVSCRARCAMTPEVCHESTSRADECLPSGFTLTQKILKVFSCLAMEPPARNPNGIRCYVSCMLFAGPQRAGISNCNCPSICWLRPESQQTTPSCSGQHREGDIAKSIAPCECVLCSHHGIHRSDNQLVASLMRIKVQDLSSMHACPSLLRSDCGPAPTSSFRPRTQDVLMMILLRCLQAMPVVHTPGRRFTLSREPCNHVLHADFAR